VAGRGGDRTESPIVVVLSGSMETAYFRGDLLFLIKSSRPLEVGDVVVYKLDDREIPIVHRILRIHKDRKDGTVRFLTKGDNNSVDDRTLYPPGQQWLLERHIVGRAYGFLPYVGMVTIVMNDYPLLKVVLLAVMGLVVITTKE
jgi:signal peptidase I